MAWLATQAFTPSGPGLPPCAGSTIGSPLAPSAASPACTLHRVRFTSAAASARMPIDDPPGDSASSARTFTSYMSSRDPDETVTGTMSFDAVKRVCFVASYFQSAAQSSAP